jgi:5'-AMP-activated protein kinase, catalytic alpha subunit
MQNAMGSEPLE